MFAKKSALAPAFCALIISAGSASAGSVYGFTGVSNNNIANTTTGEAQFLLEVGLVGGNALFTFTNNGPNGSVMSELYWDDNTGVLNAMLSIDDSDPGVDYESVGTGVSPGNLPAGNPVGFSADFATEPNNPQPHKGIGINESLGVLFSINGSFADVIAALNAGDLRVGVHAQSFANGGSESFINGGTAVPTPGTAAMGVVLLAGLAARRRRA